jgi:hypothetical protein
MWQKLVPGITNLAENFVFSPSVKQTVSLKIIYHSGHVLFAFLLQSVASVMHSMYPELVPNNQATSCLVHKDSTFCGKPVLKRSTL